MIATVYLAQNKLPDVKKALKLGNREMVCFRGLVTLTNAAQLATLLSPATIALTALNTLLLVNKIYISKKLLNMRPE